MKLINVALTALLVSTCVACGDGSDDITVSCDSPTFGICDTATTAKKSDFDNLSWNCDPGSSGVIVRACSATNRVGRCAFDLGSFAFVKHYYSPTYDVASAEASCVPGVPGSVFTPN